MQNFKKNVNGITLMALVVTIIILLILAGISIGMLSGDNGILGQAGNAKTQTDIAQEKEIIDLAVVHAMGESKYGDIDETYFTNELEKNNATVKKSGNKHKVTFSSGRQYEVDQDGNIKEKKFNPNALEISELNENASTYFGWDVINYTETLPENLHDTKWQLFYAGAIDGETEERIYLISKEYVKNTVLPVKNRATPIIVDGSDYKAFFSDYNQGNPNNGVIPQYANSTTIGTIGQNLNRKFYSYLKANSTTSSYNNIRAVAYMLDVAIWEDFKGTQADYAIGGPTVELLFTAYNKYKNLTGNTTYLTDVNGQNGYRISKDNGTNWKEYYDGMIEADTSAKDSPYIVSSGSSADLYWLASPSGYDGNRVMSVGKSGRVSVEYFSQEYCGFRPLVCLNSKFSLEKTKDSNGNDAFKIVEQ